MKKCNSICRIWGQSIAIVLGGVIYLVGHSATEPHIYDGEVVYPLLITFNSLLFPVFLGTVVLILAVTVWAGKNKFILKVVAFFHVIFVCILIVLILWQYFVSANLFHINSIRFNGKVYHVAVAMGYVLGHDCNLTAYIVYECDSVGAVCRRYSTPYLDSYTSTGCTGKLTDGEFARFEGDEQTGTLNLLVGSTTFSVIR